MKRTTSRWICGAVLAAVSAWAPACTYVVKDPVIQGDPGTGDVDAPDVPGDTAGADVTPAEVPADPGPMDAVDVLDGVIGDVPDPEVTGELPADVPADVPADCLSNCDDVTQVTPRECHSEGTPGDCGAGEACVRLPCPHCGIMPSAYCVKAFCLGDGCWVDAHCSDGLTCYGANIPSGIEGRCLAQPARAEGCWTDAECPAGASCQGASKCVPCGSCPMEDAAGSCRMPEGQQSVLLWVPGTLFSPGETIPVTWYDLTAADLFLGGCSTYSIELRDATSGDWTNKGPPVVCGVEGTAHHVAAGEGYKDFAWTAPSDMGSFPTFRLHGQYWTGCVIDKPLSGAQCTGGPIDVYSPQFNVGLVP